MEEFVALHKELLTEEHETEIQECSTIKNSLPLSELQKRGICIRKLHVLSMKTGLYGRAVVKLGLRQDKPLPSHNFSSGDIVDLHAKSDSNFSKPELQGVVVRAKDAMISVALDGDGARAKVDDLQSTDQSLILFKTANEVTYRRMQRGLDRLMHHKGAASNLIQVCFASRQPSSYQKSCKVTKFYNENLNPSQKEAIEFAMSQREIAVIHGPPGTGKTTTIAELIAQIVSNGQKVLACTPSNVAIDNILEKLSRIRIKRHKSIDGGLSLMNLIRLGHPARILTPELHRMSLDAMIAKSDSAKIVQDVRKDIDNLYSTFRTKRYKGNERSKLHEEKKLLTQELKDREKRVVKDVLSSADVVLSTNVGAHSHGPLKHLPDDHFDVVVIDECGQAMEASCWIPILQAPKLIIAGDHLQLPPTVMSHTAASKGLSTSLLERITKLHSSVVKMLDVQYRMNSKIMRWSSDNLYESRLSAHDSVKDHTLKELPGVQDTEETSSTLLLIDTAGCDMPEHQTEDHDSIGNPGEAEVVASHVSSLIEAGVNPKDIAVISPYNMQVDILRKMMHEKYIGLEIRSVDGFQGREKEAVVISLVRSNEKGIVGFLSDDRRMNVAVTRARRHLAVICDSLTVGKHKFLETLIDYMNENGQVRSAHEYSSLITNATGNFYLGMSDIASSSSMKKKKIQKTIFTTKGEGNKEKMDLGKVKLELKIITDEYIKSGKEFHIFPSTLKAHERLAVHELCEELGLWHQSAGEGNERRIKISVQKQQSSAAPVPVIQSENKKQNGEEKNANQILQENLEPEETNPTIQLDEPMSPIQHTTPDVMLEKDMIKQSEIKTTNPGSVMTRCNICERDLPQDNIQLHKVHCERLKAMKDKLQQNDRRNKKVAQPKSSGVQKTKKKKKNLRLAARDDNMNDDELLDEAIRANKSCSVHGCAEFVTVLLNTCPFCKKHFCIEHNMPELHGCGQAAHVAARRQVSREGILHGYGSTTNKKLPPEKHAKLQRKLDDKLKDMEDKRKTSKKKR